MTKARRWLRKLTALLLAMVLMSGLFLVAEAVCRFKFGAPVRFTPYPYLKGDQISEYVEIFHWRMIPNTVAFTAEEDHTEYRINSLGLRGQPLPLKKPSGALRLLFLGDSNVFGWHVGAFKTYPHQLVAFLRQRFPQQRFEELNAAVMGFSSFQCKLELDRWLRFNPDVAFITFGWNDAKEADNTDAEFHRLSLQWSYRLTALSQRLALTEAIRKVKLKVEEALRKAPRHGLHNIVMTNRKTMRMDDHDDGISKAVLESQKSKSKEPVYRVTPDEYDDNLSWIIGRCRQHKVQPVLVAISAPAAYIVQMRRIAERLDVALIETEPLLWTEFLRLTPDFDLSKVTIENNTIEGMRARTTLFVDVCHPNAAGYEVIARHICNSLGSSIVKRQPLNCRLTLRAGK